MSKLPDVLRMKVDAMRKASVGANVQAGAINSLARLAENASRAAEGSAPGVVHLCPWNTCQATRHN